MSIQQQTGKISYEILRSEISYSSKNNIPKLFPYMWTYLIKFVILGRVNQRETVKK